MMPNCQVCHQLESPSACVLGMVLLMSDLILHGSKRYIAVQKCNWGLVKSYLHLISLISAYVIISVVVSRGSSIPIIPLVSTVHWPLD